MISTLPDIKVLLWNEWDPIGVNDGENKWDDEYDSYAHGIVRLLEDGADKYKVASYLERSARVDMGLPTSSNHDAIANRVMEICENLK